MRYEASLKKLNLPIYTDAKRQLGGHIAKKWGWRDLNSRSTGLSDQCSNGTSPDSSVPESSVDPLLIISRTLPLEPVAIPD